MVTLRGNLVDSQTRCTHYHSPLDVVAIRFVCCDTFYPCFECHQETAGHTARQWPQNRLGDTPVILCGVCRAVLTYPEYTGNHDRCVRCGAAFNPGCRLHRHLYFEEENGSEKAHGKGDGTH